MIHILISSQVTVTSWNMSKKFGKLQELERLGLGTYEKLPRLGFPIGKMKWRKGCPTDTDTTVTQYISTYTN